MSRILLEAGYSVKDYNDEKNVISGFLTAEGNDIKWRIGLHTEKITGIKEEEWKKFLEYSPEWSAEETVEALKYLYESETLEGFVYES